MKRCSYCGRENQDEAVHCFECGTGFVTASAVAEVAEAKLPDQIPFRTRWILWAVAWAITAILLTIDVPGVWQAFWLFPLCAPVSYLLGNIVTAGDDWTLIISCGWLYYILLTVWGLCTPRRIVYFIIYTILCISLAVNVAGCHSVLHMKFNC